MQVIRTMSDLNTALASGTVAQCGFRRKKTGELHAGHVQCITMASGAADISLITFYPHQEIMNYLYDTSFPVPSDWDESYCINFCESNGVDVVFIPTLSEVQNTFFNNVDIPDLRNTISGVMDSNKYTISPLKMLEYAITMEYLRVTKSVYPRNTAIVSIKDGFLAFARKHYCESVLGIPFLLVDTVYRSDGLPESTTFSEMPASGVEVIAQMYQVMKNKDFDYLYELNDPTVLINELNSYGTVDIYVIDAIINKEGVVGEGKILLEVFILADNKAVDPLIVLKERI